MYSQSDRSGPILSKFSLDAAAAVVVVVVAVVVVVVVIVVAAVVVVVFVVAAAAAVVVASNFKTWFDSFLQQVAKNCFPPTEATEFCHHGQSHCCCCFSCYSFKSFFLPIYLGCVSGSLRPVFKNDSAKQTQKNKWLPIGQPSLIIYSGSKGLKTLIGSRLTLYDFNYEEGFLQQ